MITGYQMMHKQISTFAPVVLAVSLFLPFATTAQDGDEEEEPVFDENTVDCIQVRNIRRTDVLDDRNILFHMRGRTIYHNMLPRQCGGLAREDRFSYQTSIGRLCRLDSIRVLYDDPFGLRAGNRCSLGLFRKIDREDAEALKEGVGMRPEANPLPMPEPERVGEPEEE
ncbi:MAG: hypothetical protein QGF87_01335 [Woeseiaceae bacterium]|jgi:hypothetical protein|nr:hypothetical protein [Woeseiaceae bacterium]